MRLLAVAALPLVIGTGALIIRDARGPFWLGSNQDPTYTYLLDSLRVAIGLPPQHVQHPGTTVHVLGAAGVRLVHAVSGAGSLAADLVRDPERYLVALGAAFLAVNLVALAACGWTAWRATGRFLACVIAQAIPFLSAPALKPMTDVRPEALLLALDAAFLVVVLRGLRSDARGAFGPSPVALGVVCGLALATKLTALPLVLAGFVAVAPQGRLRFGAWSFGTALIAVAPALPQLGVTVQFVLQALTGPGAYGVHLLEGTYAATLRGLAPLLLVPAAGVLVTFAIAWRPSAGPREAAVRRALMAFGLGQAASLILVLLQPLGGSRYLLPTFGLFGGNLVLMLEAEGWGGWPRGRAGRTPVALALAAALGLELASVAAWRAKLGRAAADQRGAAEAARRLDHCRLVRYHKASAPEAALLLGQAGPFREPSLMAELERRYPSALFLGYFSDAGGGWSHVPLEDKVRPRLMGFRGPVPWAVLPGGACVAFQGSTAGPGRVFESGGFRRESIPVPGPVATVFLSPTEAVYTVALEERAETEGARSPSSRWERAGAGGLGTWLASPGRMRLGRNILAAAWIGLGAASLGCASLGALVGIRPPRFETAHDRPAEVRLLGPSLSRPFGGASLRLWARVENPNPFSLTLSTVTGRLILEDIEAGDVDLPLGLPLISGEAQVIPLNISVGFENVPRLAGVLADAGLGSPLGYRLEGTIGVDAGRLGQPTFGPLTLLEGDVRVRR